MKRCPTCQEEFADKFGFCPVDGTPLSNGFNASAAESVLAGQPPPESKRGGIAYTAANEPTEGDATWSSGTAHAESDGAEGAAAAAAASGYGAGQEREEYHLTMLKDQGLISRLTTEVREVGHEAGLTWPELKRDPGGFIKRGT